MIVSTPTDPQYLAQVDQFDYLPIDGAGAPISDPGYLEGSTQLDVEPIGFTRLTFVPPVPLSMVIAQINDEFVDVDFGQEMTIDAELLDPASYVINEAIGAGYPVSITAVTLISPRKIRLTISLGTNLQPYQFGVVGTVRLVTGEAITGSGGPYLAEVNPPRVVGVRATSTTTVEVTFSRPMENNADLVDPTKYKFSDGLFATGVERTGPTTVVVNTNAQIDGVTYTLQVFP